MPTLTSKAGQEVRALMEHQRDLSEVAAGMDEGLSGVVKYIDDLVAKLVEMLAGQGVDTAEVEKSGEILLKAVHKAVKGSSGV